MMLYQIQKVVSRKLLGFLIALTTVAIAYAQEQKPSGIVLEDQPGYGSCYALIVGLDYEGSKVPEAPALKNPINDAVALRDVLEKHYGFKCVLLTDNPDMENVDGLASRANIITRFDELEQQIKKEDSFLLFFAGHGLRREKEGKTYVVPALGSVAEERNLTRAELLNISELVHPTAAKHNLLIFDTCFSGSVSQLFDKFTNGKKIQKHSFSSRSFQLITSAASFQEAKDGNSKKHSPFAIELLEKLKNPENGIVRAKEDLFEHIEKRFEAHGDNAQTPQYDESNLGENHVGGEYHFVLKSKIPDLGSRTTFQMMSGRPGKWWFGETPWLSPEIRQELDRNAEIAQYADPSDLSATAKLKKVVASLNPDVCINREFVGRALKWDLLSQKEQKSAVEKALKRQSASYRGNSLETAFRKHYRANLLHFQSQILQEPEESAARKIFEAYEIASKAYGSENSALRIRCMIDQADLLLSSKKGPFETRKENLVRAVQLLENSQDLIDQALDGQAPIETKVELLCHWGTSLRKLASESETESESRRMFEDAEGKFESAVNVVVESSELSTNNLRAYVYERLAWTLMDQWKTDQAKDCFTDSLALWEGVLAKDPDALAKSLHAKHGLATVARLDGEPNAAIRAYQDVEVQISGILENSPDDVDFTERLANTKERLADAYLFSGKPALALEKYLDVLDIISDELVVVNWKDNFEEKIETKYVISAVLSRQQDDSSLFDYDVEKRVIDRLEESLGTNVEFIGTELLEKVLADDASSVYLKMMCGWWLSTKPRHAGFAISQLRSLVQERTSSVIERDEKELLLLLSEYIGSSQRGVDVQLLESVAASGGKSHMKYLRKSNEVSIAIRAELVQNKRDFDELVKKVRSAKGSRAFKYKGPFVNFFFNHAKKELLLLAYNPKIEERRPWMVAQFDLASNELRGELDEHTIRAVEIKLEAMKLPEGAKVFWSDDFLKLKEERYPFKSPENPR